MGTALRQHWCVRLETGDRELSPVGRALSGLVLAQAPIRPFKSPPGGGMELLKQGDPCIVGEWRNRQPRRS